MSAWPELERALILRLVVFDLSAKLSEKLLALVAGILFSSVLGKLLHGQVTGFCSLLDLSYALHLLLLNEVCKKVGRWYILLR